MTDNRNAFGRAYQAIHSDLRNGRFAPGTRIAAADVLPRLHISATPVREALSRLAGQSLLVDRPAIGYFVPAVDPIELKDLYGLAAALAHGALNNMDRGTIKGDIRLREVQTHHRTAGELLRAIANMSPNLALLNSAINLDDRLARLRAVETELFDSADHQQGGLEEWFARERRRAIAHHINRFYRRRIQAVMKIAHLANQTLGSAETIFGK